MSMLDIFPASVRRQIESDSLSKNDQLILATLVKEALRHAASALKAGDYKRFDANPGDGGCQTRALFFATRDVAPELLEAAKKVTTMNDTIQAFRRKPTDNSLLKDERLNLPLSQNGCFALLACIVTCTKATLRELPNGIVLDKTDISGLHKLVRNVAQLSLDRKLLVSEMQTQLARMSIAIVQQEAVQLGDPHLSKELEKVRMVRYDNFPEKPSGFLFYQIEALLGLSAQNNVVFCVRNVKPVYTCFFTAKGQSITDCDPNSKVVVFEGATTQSQQDLEERINLAGGLTRVISHLAAKEKQFGPQSSKECDDERVQAARTPLALGDFELDHIYVQTRGRV